MCNIYELENVKKKNAVVSIYVNNLFIQVQLFQTLNNKSHFTCFNNRIFSELNGHNYEFSNIRKISKNYPHVYTYRYKINNNYWEIQV